MVELLLQNYAVFCLRVKVTILFSDKKLEFLRNNTF